MKKWTKVLCLCLLVGLFTICTLTGCATVGNVKNNYNELIYNGNSAVMVDGYLYYGNSFADISALSGDGSYKASAKNSFLARVNTNAELSSKTIDHSPKKVENVSTEVAGYSNSFMFVLGNQIYYATPNRQKVSQDGNASYQYGYTCIYRSKLNGDNKKKLYTTSAEIKQIEVLKEGKTYYIVIFAGDKLVKINLSNSKASTIAEGVTSVAMPKTFQKDKIGSTWGWNEFVYFTKALSVESGSGATGNVVSRVKLSDGKVEEVYNNNSDITFIGREKDVIFYTETNSGSAETYMKNMTTSNGSFANYDARIPSSISDIHTVSVKTTEKDENGETQTKTNDLGWIYTVGSNLGYRTVGGRSGYVSFSDGTQFSTYKLLFVDGQMIYLSTTTGIFTVDLSNVFSGESTTVEAKAVVTMTAIHEGALYAFDGSYIYYYAKLEEIEPEKDENGEEKEPETDDNYYLYRAKVGRAENVGADKNYELLGLTSINSRRS